ELRSLKGHDGYVRSVAFSSDGWRLASASSDGTVKLWDASPLTPEIIVECEALGLIEFLFNKPLRNADISESIHDNKTISEEVRRRALTLLERFPGAQDSKRFDEASRRLILALTGLSPEEQDPKRFDEASRRLIRQQYLSSNWYRQALLQAEAACRLAPKRASYRNTFGIAHYRLGKYREAVEALMQCEQRNAAQKLDSLPANLAFLAMAYHRLGQRDKAQTYLSRLREMMKKAHWTQDEEAQIFLREAEALFSEPAGILQN